MTRIAIVLVLLLPCGAWAQPAHCERALGDHTWPIAGDPQGSAPSDPIDRRTMRARIAQLRRAWRRLRVESPVLRSFSECMLASDEHFLVRRVDAAIVRQRLEGLRRDGFGAAILADHTSALGDWAFEIYWGGGSRRHPPSGAISGYLSADGRTLIAAVHWPEG